jgi:transcriptional regulator with XRE-family HTH domain
MKYHEILKRYIKNSRLTLSEICEMLKPHGYNMDKSYLSRLQNGKADPASETLNKALATITNGNAEKLLTAAFLHKAPESISRAMIWAFDADGKVITREETNDEIMNRFDDDEIEIEQFLHNHEKLNFNGRRLGDLDRIKILEMLNVLFK